MMLVGFFQVTELNVTESPICLEQRKPILYARENQCLIQCETKAGSHTKKKNNAVNGNANGFDFSIV